jgi:hypothetical protein
LRDFDEHLLTVTAETEEMKDGKTDTVSQMAIALPISQNCTKLLLSVFFGIA